MKILLYSTLILSSFTLQEDPSRMFVAEDFEVSLWAETPMFYNPTNMDVDAKGRIWITEAVEYRDFNNKPDGRFNFKDKGDRVVILEDTNQDGKADKSTVFVQDIDLKAPLGIAVIGNKVIVSAAPHVLIYTDENQDDKPDKKEIFLKGFGGFDHDHSLHSFIATPYGKYLFNVGNAGPHTVIDKSGWTLRSGSMYSGGTPYNKENSGNRKSDDGRVWVGGLALEIGSDATELKVLAHNFRNSYEIAMDSFGNMWQNDNDDQVIACRSSWLMEGSDAGYFSKDGTRSWQGDRRPGQDIFSAHWHSEDPGVLQVGDKTGAGSPTGVMVYEGDAFGQKYQGMFLSCEAGRNVVFGYLNKPKAAGFEMKRFDLLSSLQSSEEHYIWNENVENNKSKWFRPSDAATGTDGSIFVADWYDPVVGGHAMKDKEGYGRIYRITPKSKKLKTPLYDFNTVDGLLEVLKSPAINVRNVGFDKLKTKGSSVIPKVLTFMEDTNPYIKARAVWLLASLGKEGKAAVEKILYFSEGELQIAAFRALKKLGEPMEEYSMKLLKTVSAGLRREIAISMRDVQYEKCKNILLSLSKEFKKEDTYLLTALGIGIDRKKDLFYVDFKKTLPENPLFYSESQSAILWEIHPQQAINSLVLRANSVRLTAAQRKEAITSIAFINSRLAANSMIILTKSSLNDVSSQAQYWVNFRKSNDWQNLIDWKTMEKQTLTVSQKNMIIYKNEILLEKTSKKQKAFLIEKLALDGYGGRLLLVEVVNGKLPNSVKEMVNLHIFNNKDLSIRSMASDYFKRPGGRSLSLDLALNMPSDKVKGKEVFVTNCQNCHKIGNEGADIGPDLTLIKNKYDKNALLDAIINPSANLAFGYEPWLFTTSQDSYFGFLIADGQNIVIKDLLGKLTTLKAKDVKSRTQQKNSLMPDPSTLQIKEKDLSDLAGFLLSL